MGLIIIAYAFTITFLPQCKTIRGGLQVLKECGTQSKKTVFHEGYDAIADVQGVSLVPMVAIPLRKEGIWRWKITLHF
jgi:hypothetical protein